MKYIKNFKDNVKIKLYHGTCLDNAKSLVDNGWSPKDYIGSNLGEFKYLYLSSGIDDALWFAEQKGCNTILEITIDDFSFISPDPHDEAGFTMDELLHRMYNTKMPSKFILKKPLDKNHFKIIEHGMVESFGKSFSKIYDAFNTSVDVEYSKTLLGYKGEFDVYGNKYMIKVHNISNGFLTYKFSRKDENGKYSQEMFNDISKFKVIPTIKQSITHFLNNCDTGILFASLDKSIGRKNIYKKFCVEYCSVNSDYEYFIYSYDMITVYLVYRKSKNINNNDILAAIEESSIFFQSLD